MLNRISHSFPSDHPSVNGHFPGNPIIPGAVLLNDVVDTIGAAEHALPMSYEVSAAKFLRPVRPGSNVTITWEKRASGEIRFECLLAPDDQAALTGVLKLIGGQA